MSRTFQLILLVFAVAIVSAPVAQSDDWYRDTRITATDTHVRPDDRGGLLGVGAVEASNAAVRAARHPNGVPDSADVPPVVVRIEPQPRDGFDWSAALLGAGAAAGLALVLAGSLVVMRTRTAGALQ
jgi:hypothetical protein